MNRPTHLRLHFAGAATAKLAPPLVQFVLLLLVARSQTLSDVGLLALASAASFLCGALAELGFATTLSLPRPTFGTEEPPLRATTRLRVLASLAGSALYAILWLAGLGGYHPVLLLAVPLPCALSLSYSYSGAMNASGMLRIEGAVTIAESIAILSIAALFTAGGSALTGALIGLTIGRLGGTVARAVLVRRIPQSTVPRLEGLVRAQLPYALATLVIVIQSQADVLVIGFFGELALAGIYGPLIRAAYAPILGAEALSWSLYGKAHPDERGDTTWLARHWRAVGIGLGVVVAALFVLLAEPFMRFLLHRPLPDLSPAVVLLGVAVVARFVALVFNVQVLRAGRQRDEIPVLAGSSVVLAIGAALAASAHSLTGLAGARCASEAIIAIGYVLLARRPPLRRAVQRQDRRARSEKLRLLFLTPFPPSLDGAHGGSRVIAQLLERLGRRHDVRLLCLRHPSEPSLDGRLRESLDAVVEVPRSDAGRSLRSRMARSVRSRARLMAGTPLWASEIDSGDFRLELRRAVGEWQPDVVQFEYPVMALYLDEVRSVGGHTVLTVHDPPTNAAIDLGRASKRDRVLRRLDIRAWRAFERRVLGLVDAAVAFTGRDVEALQVLAPGSDVVQIPFGTDFFDRVASPTRGAAEILFVGNFVHPPNVDAADRLVRSIFPRVRDHVSAATLSIVGDNAPPELRDRPGDGVEVTGRVPDLVPFVSRAAVVAAPIRFGGGMRVKVLEALAAGKAVVASRLAVEGLAVDDGDQLLIAETDEEFAAAIVRLLRDPELRDALGARAWAWARANLTWDTSIAAYEALYGRLLRPGLPSGEPLGESPDPAAERRAEPAGVVRAENRNG